MQCFKGSIHYNFYINLHGIRRDDVKLDLDLEIIDFKLDLQACDVRTMLRVVMTDRTGYND